MEVKNPQAAILSNYEVLSLINEMKPARIATSHESSQVATIMYETSHYLQELPCDDQNSEKIDKLMTLLKDFSTPLTKLEKLMICNDPPQSALQLSLIVKECEERLPESEVQLWLDKINKV